MKLCMLPPSTSTTTWWSAIRPNKCNVSGARWPAKELKLIWAEHGSMLSGGSRGGSYGTILGRVVSSSSVINRKTLEAQPWPLWYFLSQLKQRLRSCWEASSSGERRFNDGGVGRPGEGSSGGRETECGGGKGWCGGARGRDEWRTPKSFSSWRQSRLAACTKVRGWCASTSCRISGVRLDTKQLRRKGDRRPMIWLARSSNSDRYCATVPHCVNLNRAPIGSLYCDGMNLVYRAWRKMGQEVNWSLPVIHWNHASARPSI